MEASRQREPGHARQGSGAFTSGGRGVLSVVQSGGGGDSAVTLSMEAPPVYGAVAERGGLGIGKDGRKAREEEMEAAEAAEAGVAGDEPAAVVSAPEAAAAAVLASADRDASRWLPVGGPGDVGGTDSRALTRREQEGLKRHALAAAALTSSIPGTRRPGNQTSTR